MEMRLFNFPPLDPKVEKIAEKLSLSSQKEKLDKLLSKVKVAYTDVDGTLMGPGGCFLLNAKREFTLGPVKTLITSIKEGIDIMLVSGRTSQQLLEVARLLGLKNYIAELGLETIYNQGEEVRSNLGFFKGKTNNLLDFINELGVVDFLFTRYPNQLELHTPWALDRKNTPLLRGLVNLEEVNELLRERFPGLIMVDNGVIPREYPDLKVAQVRAYHIMPLGVTKEGAVEQDMFTRGFRREETIAIGDSEADLPFAEKVGAFFLVRNGLYASPQIIGALGKYENIFITDGYLNEGWAEVLNVIITHNRSLDS